MDNTLGRGKQHLLWALHIKADSLSMKQRPEATSNMQQDSAWQDQDIHLAVEKLAGIHALSACPSRRWRLSVPRELLSPCFVGLPVVWICHIRWQRPRPSPTAVKWQGRGMTGHEQQQFDEQLHIEDRWRLVWLCNQPVRQPCLHRMDCRMHQCREVGHKNLGHQRMS